MKRFIALVAFAAALGAPPLHAQDPWGGPLDVPTWRPGDSWTFHRTFTINATSVFNVITGLDAQIDLKLDFTDDYATALDSIANVSVAPPAFAPGIFTGYTARAYKRSRTSGSLGATGGGRLSLLFPATPPDPAPVEYVDFTLSTAAVSSANGFNWTGVGDLSQLRDHFSTPYVLTTMTVTNGTTTTCSVVADLGSQILPNNIYCPCTAALRDAAIACYPDTANSTTSTTLFLAVDVTLDHEVQGSGLELIDFPVLDPYQDNASGEEFTEGGKRAFYGRIQLDGDGVAGGEILNQQFATPQAQALDYDIRLESLNATEPGSGATGLAHLKGQGAAPFDDEIYYNPAAKDLQLWRMGSVGYSTGTPGVVGFLYVTLADFATNNTAAILQPDSNLAGLALSPSRPLPDHDFQVSGTTTGSDTEVQCRIILPGNTGALVTAPIVGGAFTATLHAPAQNDMTPSASGSRAQEAGSFGVEVIRNGESGGYSRKVITARLATGTGRDVGDFDNSGCTDVADFLFLLDNWLLISSIGAPEIGISDFLNLLDNWQLGDCP